MAGVSIWGEHKKTSSKYYSSEIVRRSVVVLLGQYRLDVIVVIHRFVFQLEGPGFGNCPKDFVEFFDGNSTASPSIGKFCGTDNVPNILSSNSSLTVRFFSDAANVSDVGFKLHVEPGNICLTFKEEE